MHYDYSTAVILLYCGVVFEYCMFSHAERVFVNLLSPHTYTYRIIVNDISLGKSILPVTEHSRYVSQSILRPRKHTKRYITTVFCSKCGGTCKCGSHLDSHLEKEIHPFVARPRDMFSSASRPL